MKPINKFSMLAVLMSAAMFVTSCKQEQKQAEEAQSFPTEEVSASDISITTTYSASIQGRQNIKLIPRVDGYLTKVLVVEGQEVRKGQSMFIIDEVPFVAAYEAAKAQVEMAEANVATAELTLKSKQSLFDKQIISEFDLQNAKNQLLTTQASLALANANKTSAANNLSYTNVKSPVDGVIGKLPFREGDYVSPAMQSGLTTVADNSQMYVYFSMTEKDVLSILTNFTSVKEAIDSMPAIELRLSNGKIYEQKGHVESISGVVDETTGALSLRAAFDNPKGHLLSGGAGTVIVPTLYKDVFVVPQVATYEIQHMTYLYKVIDGKAVASIIEVEPINDGKQFVVRGGLEAGERIVTSGVLSVREGMQIL